MSDSGGGRFFVLTLRGERGPVDRQGLRELLQQGEIRAEDQVRNAFGRNLGTVRDVLASQPRGLPSGRQPQAASAASPARRAPMVPIAIAVGILLLVAVVLSMRSGEVVEAPTRSEPVRPAPPTSPSGPPATAPQANQPEKAAPPPSQPSQPPPPPPPPPVGKIASSAYQSGQAYASNEFQAAGEGLLQGLDGRVDSKWLCRFPEGADASGRLAWLRLDPRPSARRIRGYALTSANDVAERDPQSWTLVGIDGTGAETRLDQRDNERFAQRFQRREFIIPAPASYPAYRLDIRAVAGGADMAMMQIAEIELLPAP
jgi:hypothetical protein